MKNLYLDSFVKLLEKYIQQTFDSKYLLAIRLDISYRIINVFKFDLI